MVVVEGVARKLDPRCKHMGNIKTSFRKMVKETKDPVNEIGNIFKKTSEVIKRLPRVTSSHG